MNIQKVYLFDSKQTLKSKTVNDSSSLKTVQLYEKFDGCSKVSPKPIPYDLRRSFILDLFVNIKHFSSFRSCFLHLYIRNNWITKSSCDQTLKVSFLLISDRIEFRLSFLLSKIFSWWFRFCLCNGHQRHRYHVQHTSTLSFIRLI